MDDDVVPVLTHTQKQDARSFMMSFQYWLGGSPENLEAMLLMMANNYVYEGQKQIEAEKIAEAYHSQKFSSRDFLLYISIIMENKSSPCSDFLYLF